MEVIQGFENIYMNADKACIYWCDIGRLEYSREQIEICDSLTGLKCPDYQRREDTTRHITGLLLAEWALNGYYGNGTFIGGHIISSKIQQDRGEKPYYKDYPQLDFSVSHSGTVVLCVIAGCRVGVDIEKAERPIADMMNRICSEEERRWLAYNNNMSNYYSLWTYKESLLKCTGEGIKSIENMVSMVKGGKMIGNHERYRFRKLMIKKGYETTLCMDCPVNLISIEEVAGKWLEKFLNRMSAHC